MTQKQKPAPRTPRQERARQKVELILEAAIRLLDKGGLPRLTTNAVAETAGISVGTLYQYFANKEAILDALADRQTAGTSERVLAALQDPTAMSPQDRVRRIVRAISTSYGERRHVHRLVIEYSLARGGKRLFPLIEQITALLASPDRPPNAPILSPAEAFVLTNAFVGVMRAIIMRADDGAPRQDEIEEALAQLMTTFMMKVA